MYIILLTMYSCSAEVLLNKYYLCYYILLLLSLYFTKDLESIAETLKDASREELLDALRTVEGDCLKHKETLDRLFGLIIGHTPDLLSIMAEVQQPDK